VFFRYDTDLPTVKEGGRMPPPYPSLFIKPSTVLADFDAEILIPQIAQETLDYEDELVSHPCILSRPKRDNNPDSDSRHRQTRS
jgi:hypothetical protein